MELKTSFYATCWFVHIFCYNAWFLFDQISAFQCMIPATENDMQCFSSFDDSFSFFQWIFQRICVCLDSRTCSYLPLWIGFIFLISLISSSLIHFFLGRKPCLIVLQHLITGKTQEDKGEHHGSKVSVEIRLNILIEISDLAYVLTSIRCLFNIYSQGWCLTLRKEVSR